MISPGIFNIQLQRSSSYSILLEFKDGNGSPIALTGWTVAAQVWSQSRNTKYADFNVTYVSREQSKVRLSLTYTQTASLPIQAVYDVLLIDPDNIREYYLEGAITVSQSYTSVP